MYIISYTEMLKKVHFSYSKQNLYHSEQANGVLFFSLPEAR